MVERNEKIWVMVDIEADGPIPGDYSMIELGAIAVNPDKSMLEFPVFYAQFRPISSQWVPAALAVSGFSRKDTLEFPDVIAFPAFTPSPTFRSPPTSEPKDPAIAPKLYSPVMPVEAPLIALTPSAKLYRPDVMSKPAFTPIPTL